MTKQKKILSYIVNAVLVAVLFATMQVLISSGAVNAYYSGILMVCGINIILAVSLNLATGFLGQLVLGHAGFMSVGAYSAALFTMNSGLPEAVAFPIALVVGGVVAAIFGTLIGIPALRLRGDYLAIITLGFGEIIRVIIQNLGFTGGAKGLRGIPGLTTFGYVFWVAVITIFVVYTFIHSRHGRAVISIREDEIAAEASGINTTYYKMAAFVLAAFFAGVAGALYAHYIGVLGASNFNFDRSIEILVMVVLGGMGSITGSVVAAGVLTILPEMLRGFSEYRLLIYSVVLILMMLFRPTGLFGQSEMSIVNFPQKVRRFYANRKKARLAAGAEEPQAENKEEV